jgi:hypothetical protein
MHGMTVEIMRSTYMKENYVEILYTLTLNTVD